ncbi:MAG TPA: rRNA adenine N-6-methyltransferase family protein [Acidimicrobiales bacterium]|nr:rRNA adenine N-6-methyltransferase family protein [Acidimicrobiales bacterium]
MAAPAARQERRRWGSHRLDRRSIERLVDAACVTGSDFVVDAGAGDGRITALVRERGARVLAVELHPARVAALRRRFADDDGVIVVRADAGDLRLPRRPFVVVANPPFAITTALLRRLTHSASALERAAIVVPTWQAARWAATRSSATFAFAHAGHVPRTAFTPPPPRDAAIVVVRRRA